MSEFLNDYFQNRFFNIGVKEVLDKDLIDPLLAPLTPFANPFAERKKPSFPVPSDFRRVVEPTVEMDTTPIDVGGDSSDDFYSPGYDPTTGERREEPSVEPIDPKGGMASLVVEEKVPDTGIKGLITAAVEKELGFPTEFSPITGTERVSDISGAMGNIPMGMTTLGSLTALGSELNKKNLSEIATRAALGQQGYAVGMFENQIIGTKPNVPIPQGSPVVPNALQNKVVKQLQELGEQGKGAGVLGKAYEQYVGRGGRFDMSRAVTPEMIAYESVVKGLKVDDDLKAKLLGYGTRVPDVFQPRNYYTITPYEQVQKDIEQTAKNRAGDVDSGFTDVSAPSIGLEGDIDAQQSQVNPMGINLGINMSNISGVPTGVNVPDYTDDGGGSDPSDPSSTDTGSVSEGGYGGVGFTAYGGKIGMFGGGFASKVAKIKGVGLIKPEQTFLDTDMVRDRFEFDAVNGDYIINGPSSDVMQPQIAALIDYGINQLKKEGVDIRVGNSKIKDENKVPLIVASSETYIPRVIAEKIGYPILEAINNIGKPEVKRLSEKLKDQPTDKGKYQAQEGMLVKNPEQGFLFRRPDLKVTGPNVDRIEEGFVPGISDNPPAMNLDQQTFFDDYEFGDIKKAIKKTEIQGFEKYPYIFTGVKAKKGKSSSAFGPMQITKALIEDFEKRSPDYKTLSKEEKNYLKALKIQGEDKINQELYGTVFRGPEELRKKVDARKIYGKKAKGLKPYGRGTIDPKLHEKYYDKIADVILLHKLGDHDNIEDFLASYGEGADYADKVLNDLLDIIQIK
tara:strand:+ start:1856 stop:4231 length:2376 start_codon:yes stop_codon:yes gene_type:complete